jgi:hypothetical protein
LISEEEDLIKLIEFFDKYQSNVDNLSIARLEILDNA